MVAIPFKAGNFTCGETNVKNPTCSLPAPHAVSFTRMQANLPAIRRRIYSWCDSRLPAIAVFLPAIAGILPAIAGIFACNCWYFCLQLLVFLPAVAGIFACNCGYLCLRLRVFLPAFAGFFAWNCGYFRLQLRVFSPAFPGIFACVCWYLYLQKQAILHASRGHICIGSACKITGKIPVIFR